MLRTVMVASGREVTAEMVRVLADGQAAVAAELYRLADRMALAPSLAPSASGPRCPACDKDLGGLDGQERVVVLHAACFSPKS